MASTFLYEFYYGAVGISSTSSEVIESTVQSDDRTYSNELSSIEEKGEIHSC